jgi:hypothetical protein
MAAVDSGIATTILKPSRINSLGRIDLRVIEHVGESETKDFTVQVYPFERVLSLKQRIAETYGRTNIKHLPEYLFIAVSAGDGFYMPLEYVWNIEHEGRVQDPLNLEIESTILSPDKHATEHMGMLLEDLVDISSFREVHIWSLDTIVQAAGIVDSSVEIPSDRMNGYFKLYFPRVSPQVLFQDFTRRLDEGELEDAESALAYHTELDKRLEKLDVLIPKLRTSCVLNQLHRLVYYIPPNPEFKSSADLELTFYETKVSEKVPFVRYFPGNQRSSAPMIKLAESETAGQPAIDQTLLSKMLRDLPEMDEEETRYGVLMYKIPVIAPRIPADTMWTLTLFGHDGSASLVLTAPRKDEPLRYEAVSAAMALIPNILSSGGINTDITPLELKELNASYRIDVSDLEHSVPTLKSLESRIDVFQSFLSKSKKLESQRVSLTLRYKTVSNFVKESNPVFDHLTYVTLDKGTKDKLLSKEEYIQEVVSHFGYSRVFAEKYIAEWASLHSEHIARGKSIFDRVNPGALIGVYANHPKYDFILNNIQSQRDLERILTIMSVFVSNPTSELVIADSVSEMEEVAGVMAEANRVSSQNGAVAAEAAAEAAQNMGEMSEEEMQLMYASLGYDEDVIEEMMKEAREAKEQRAAAAAVEAPAPVETAVAPGPGTEVSYGKADVDLLTRLYQANSTLFKYKPDAGKHSYAKTCQASSGRQPNVMSLPQYRRARELYKDTVTWVEAPLEESDVEAVQVVSTAISSRTVGGRSERKVYEMELRALELGFPLKGDKSIIESAKAGVFTKEEKEDMKRRIEVQKKSPPLWIVFRIGSSSEEGTRTNYYICAEYWCLHDNLPILPAVFDKIHKCPFCGGGLIVNPDSPGKGETVLKRKDANGIKKYVGFFDQLHHPDGYAVPCCFNPPSEIKPPKGMSKSFPPPQMDLPPQQTAAIATVVDQSNLVEDEDTYRDRPFTAKRDKVKKNEWYIPNQKIVGRTIEGWVDITPKFRGIVSVPPQTVNTLLEQDPEKFLTAIHGVQAKSQNSYLAVPGRAFVRYGLGTDGSTPGDNLFSLIAFADYAMAFLHDENANTAIRSNESVLNFMTSDDPILTRRMLSVFEQANYGTLLHEFTVPQVELLDEQLVHFERWWTNTAGRYKSPSDKKYAIQTYLAFENFKAYVKDTSIKKDLRYFMSFFTTPKLLTSQGFIPIVINYYRKNTPATIMCPEFGISFYNQPAEHRPPLLFIVHDVDTGIFDPLVVYEGVKLPDGSTEQRVCGLIHPKTPSFARLSPEFRSSIQAFIDKYFSPAAKGGCGVDHAFIHPWMPVRDTSRVPRLSELITVLDLQHKKVPIDDGKAPRDKYVLTGDIRKEALFRDSRTNRLIGVIVRHSQPRRYILVPCIDDGYIHPASISDAMKNVRGDLFDENATFKAPMIEDIFFVLTGKQKTVDETRLAGHFEAYTPVKLHDRTFVNPETGARETRFVAVELACGIWIPCQPARAAEVREIRSKFLERALAASGASSPVDKMPWDLNATVLGPEKPESESIDYTTEEALDESYQLFRLSFSEWLRNHPSVRDQIELLRRARTRLPLYELQKRLEILITAIVNPTKNETWFTETDAKTSRPFYRRNCLKLKKSECSAGCMWVPLGDEDDDSQGRCLIHTHATERYIHPIETLIARLVDELLRTFSLADEILSARVPRLPALQQGSLEHEDGAILFSLPGRGDDDLYSQLGYKGRKPSEYTQGIVFPEETSKSGLFEEGDIPGDMSSEWSAIFRHLLVGPELSRSERLKFQTIISQIADMPITNYEAYVGHTIVGTESDWKELGERRKINIVFTKVNEATHFLEPYRLLRTDSEKYVILDMEQIPLQHKTTNGVIIKYTDLPKSIRSWLGTQGISLQPELPTLPPVAPALAAAAAAPKPKPATAGPKRRIKYPLGKTKDDGNCFFSAIFRAAKEHGKPVVDQLAKCLGINASTESKFIQTFRKALSDYMKSGKLEPTYRRAKEVSESQPANFAQIITSYPKWFPELFGEFGGELGTYDEFVNRYAEKIKEDKSWVAEIDVELVNQLILEKGCNFKIDIKTSNLISKVGELKTMTDDGKILLNLINQGEQHYEYFKLAKDAEDGE